MAVVVGRGSTCTHTCTLTDHPIKEGSFQEEVFLRLAKNKNRLRGRGSILVLALAFEHL